METRKLWEHDDTYYSTTDIFVRAVNIDIKQDPECKVFATYHMRDDFVAIYSIVDWGTLKMTADQAEILLRDLANELGKRKVVK